MKRIILLCTALAATFIALPAGAEIYQWTDASGKKVISDKPPPGQLPQVKEPNTEAAEPGEPQNEVSANSEAKKEKTWADREMEFRQRKLEQAEKQEKAKQEAAAADEKKAYCDGERRRLKSLESGIRIATMNDKGEREFMEDAQRAKEVEKARNNLSSRCQ